MAADRDDIVRIGYFGSYARGDWGPGSDLDLVALVQDSDQPFDRRPISWDTTPLPVGADLLVYTLDEWNEIEPDSRFGRTLHNEVVWVYRSDA